MSTAITASQIYYSTLANAEKDTDLIIEIVPERLEFKQEVFARMDGVGLDVVYDIEMQYYLDSGDPKDRPPDMLKAMIDRGEPGMKSGKGFYDWKNPEFSKPDFLTPFSGQTNSLR